MSPRLIGAVAATACCLVASGCSDPPPEPPPIVWEGEHLRFGTDADEATICAGTLPYLDDVVGHLGEVFERPEVEVDFYWVPDDINRYCTSEGFGCTNDLGAFSRFPVHQHELVHAIRRPRQAYLPIEEGLAEAFGDDWDPPPYPFEGEIRDILEHPRDHFPGSGYLPAGHFVSYLHAAHGIEPLLELDGATDYDSSFSQFESTFEPIFGLPLEDALADYEASYPRCPSRAFRDKTVDCNRNVVRVPIALGEPAEMNVSMACDDPGVIGPRLGLRWTTVTMEVQAEGRHHIVVLPGTASALELIGLTRCDVDCFSYDEDSFSRTTGTQLSFSECLEPGRYSIRLAIEDGTDDEYWVQVTRNDDAPCE